MFASGVLRLPLDIRSLPRGGRSAWPPSLAAGSRCANRFLYRPSRCRRAIRLHVRGARHVRDAGSLEILGQGQEDTT